MPDPTPHLPALRALAAEHEGWIHTSLLAHDPALRRALPRYARGDDAPFERGARGTYRDRSTPRSWRCDAVGALLAAGRGALLCRRSAARLLGLDGVDRYDEIDVFHVRARHDEHFRHSRASIVGAAETDGLPHTDALTTLAQLGAVVTLDELEQAVESALRLGLVTWEELWGRLGRSGSDGLGALRKVLLRRPADLPPTGSVLETRAWQLLRRSKVLVLPLRQHPVFDAEGRLRYRVDLCWPELRLYIELDGRAFHDPLGHPYEHDRANAIAISLGWVVIHLRWADVVHHPNRTLRLLEDAYLAARARLAS